MQTSGRFKASIIRLLSERVREGIDLSALADEIVALAGRSSQAEAAPGNWFTHPAVMRFKRVTGRYAEQIMFREIVDALSDCTDDEARAAYQDHVLLGRNPGAYVWLRNIRRADCLPQSRPQTFVVAND